MAQNGTQGGKAVAKVQKSLMLAEDLHRLVQVVEEKSGASFTRIMTAGVLSYLFNSFQNPVKGQAHGPDPTWMRTAVLLERGDLSVRDLALALLDNLIESQEMGIKFFESDPHLPSDKVRVESLRTQLKDTKAIRRSWANRVKELGGPMEALIDVLESHWLKPGEWVKRP